MSLTINGTNGIETNTDTGKIKVGTDDDLQIYHDGSNSKIINNTGYLNIRSDSFWVGNNGETEAYIQGVADGAVTLSYNGVDTCSTSANGLAFPSGKGIDFSATSDGTTMSSELLDDYEEGSFTPSYYSPDTNAGFAHYQHYGKYTKIGNIVTVNIYISGYCNNNAGGGSNDNVKIIGLPFTPASNTGSGDGRNTANFAIGNRYKIECDDLTAYCYAGNTHIDLLVPSNGGTGTMLKTNQVDQNTTQFFATSTYRV